MKTKISVIKIGGKLLSDEQALADFLTNFSNLKGLKILVHGGGNKATALGKRLNIKTKMIDGRRVTCPESLEIVQMVYAGLINKSLVAKLNTLNVNGIGISGMDGKLIPANLRIKSPVDFGLVGDIASINIEFLKILFRAEITPIIAPLGCDENGQILNINADTVAAEIAIALSDEFEVDLFYCFEKNGVLKNDRALYPKIDLNIYREAIALKKINEGMVAKIYNALQAKEKGVKQVFIGSQNAFSGIHFKGTEIISE